MNKFRLFLGIVSTVVTVFNLFFVGGILYGTYNPTSPVLMSIFLVIVSIITGALSTQCLYRYVEVDYV
jgi:hypothetical protein